MPGEKKFKTCPMCLTEWRTRDDFLEDPTLELNGYGADFEKLELSLFYFTHKIEGCFSTMTIVANEFLDLYSGKKYKERRTGKDECPGYCLEIEQLNRCDALCECAFNREVIKIIQEKQSTSS